MTRRDFDLIAEVLLSSKPAARSGRDMFEQWEWTIEIMAVKLSVINSNFDRDLFRKACGL